MLRALAQSALVWGTQFALIGCVSAWFQSQQNPELEPQTQAQRAHQPDPLVPAHENLYLLITGNPPNDHHTVMLVPRGRSLNIPRDALPAGLLPAPGQCSPLAQEIPSTSSPKLRAVRHGSNFQLDPANESPVFIVDRASGQIHSVAQPDDLGAFACESLPVTRGYFTTNGPALQALEHEDADELITLTGEDVGQVSVIGSDLSGWLLRIGPAAPTDPLSNAAAQADPPPAGSSQTESNPVPIPDALRMTSKIAAPSYGFEASHAFDRSFIFQDREPSLMLPAGRYTLAFVRLLDFNMCVLNVQVQSGQKLAVSCPPQVSEKVTSETSEPIGLMVSQSSLNPSRPQWNDAIIPGVKFFSLTGTGSSLSIRNSRQSEWVLDDLFFDFTQEISRQKPKIDSYLAESQVPSLAVVRNAGELGTPLLIQTRLWPMTSETNRTDTQNILTQVTNGALVRWNSPIPKGSLTEMNGDGSFSFTVSLPPYDLTDYIEIYLNSRLFKRYIVGRRKPNEPLSMTFEEAIQSEVDFLITIFTWGKGYLPELIFGQRFLRPRAIHSKICFDVNKNQICDNIDEEEIPSNGFNPMD